MNKLISLIVFLFPLCCLANTKIDPYKDIQYLKNNALKLDPQELMRTNNKNFSRSRDIFMSDLEAKYFDSISTKASAPQRKKSLKKRER